MKTHLIVVLILIISASLYGQKADSIKISKRDKAVLIGTTVLHGSEKNMSSAMSYGLLLEKLSQTNCLNIGTDFNGSIPSDHISSINFRRDSLIVEAQIGANCSHHFLGEIEVVEDSIINLVYHGYGGYAFCNCCFGLTYFIKPLVQQNFQADKVKYVMIDKSRKSMKRVYWKNN